MVKDVFWGMSEEAIRERVVAEAWKLLGIREGTTGHGKIVDIYNSMPKLPRGYKLQYDDPWCAATMSYVGIVLGITDVILPECSCSRMIELYKKAGRWEERDDYVPELADLIMYDWDAQKGECTGNPEHVGMVVGKRGRQLQILEGNYGDKVELREIPVEYIKTRGYCLPDYGRLVHGFTDVPEDAWYRKAVQWADGRGIVEGIGEREFAPNMACTRAHMVAMLWRLAGKPEAKPGPLFVDVQDGAWYYKAVAWAAGEGITEGIAEWMFDPHSFCTRAQVAAMIWRWRGRPQPESADHPFTDVAGNAWYADAVEWCWCEGITIGYSGTEFNPYGSCNRAQVAEMLYRLNR